MAGWAAIVWSWAVDHAELLSLIFVPVWLLAMLGPKLLVDSIPEPSLPDAVTGFRRSDALPIMPPSYVRFLTFLYSAHAVGMAMPHRRWLVRLVRIAVLATYLLLGGLFVFSIASDTRFDPDADILKTDSQRAIETAGGRSGSPN